MWIQSPEYDSIDISGVGSCQRHLTELSAEGLAARGQSTRQRTSRDSPVPMVLPRSTREGAEPIFLAQNLLVCWCKAVSGASLLQSEITRL